MDESGGLENRWGATSRGFESLPLRHYVLIRNCFKKNIESYSFGFQLSEYYHLKRKEKAPKVNQLRSTYGESVQFVLFLCGYFDSGYLGYEAAEGIDWIWEHRIDDFEELGL